MNRLPLMLSAFAALFAAGAAALILSGGIAGAIAGVLVAVTAIVLAMAAFGIARDPEAREQVSARVAAARGEQPQPAQAPAAPVTVDDELSQGFSVSGANRRPAPQDRKQKRASKR